MLFAGTSGNRCYTQTHTFFNFNFIYITKNYGAVQNDILHANNINEPLYVSSLPTEKKKKHAEYCSSRR